MVRKCFTKPEVEVVSFMSGVLATSGCGCYDEDWCPSDYKNCTRDGAGCACEINYNPAIANCITCDNNG